MEETRVEDRKEINTSEFALRNAIIERLRKIGIEVVTASEEGQRVMDMASSFGLQPRLMGNRVKKRMSEIGFYYSNKQLTLEERAVADVFGGKKDRVSFNLNSDKGQTTIEMQQGNENHAGAKHSVYRHYNTAAGHYTINELTLIPDIIKTGNRVEESRNVVYTKTIDGVRYKVVTEVKSGKEVFQDFYTNRKAEASKSSKNTPSGARTDEASANSFAKLPKNNETAKENAAKIREHRVFHGSGADFDRFDHSHMGEGEGNQAYGWGTYVTEVEGIGQKYASLSSQSSGLRRSELESNISRGKERVRFMQGEYREEELAQIEKWEKELAGLQEHKHLYTVEIPDDTGENYLDWEKPLTAKQHDTISGVIKKLKIDLPDYERRGFSLDGKGEDVYKFLSYALRNTKKWEDVNAQRAASKFLSSLGITGIKYSADYQRGGREDGKKNYVVFDEADAKITDHVRFFRTENGESYGFTVGGKIYIDPKIATAETPIHEYAHLWSSALRNGNPQEWKNVVELMKGTSVWDEVKKTYQELGNDDEIADEVIATYSGRQGAERLRREAEKHPDAEQSTLDRIGKALEKFWHSVADFLNIHYTSAEEVSDTIIKDLLTGVNPLTAAEEEIMELDRKSSILKDLSEYENIHSQAVLENLPEGSELDRLGTKSETLIMQAYEIRSTINEPEVKEEAVRRSSEAMDEYQASLFEYLGISSYEDIPNRQKAIEAEIAKKATIPNPIYTAYFVDDKEALRAKYAPVHPKEYYDHMTLAFRPATADIRELGEERELKVLGRLTTDKVDTLVIDNPDADYADIANSGMRPEIKHITLSTADGVAPVESNKELYDYYTHEFRQFMQTPEEFKESLRQNIMGISYITKRNKEIADKYEQEYRKAQSDYESRFKFVPLTDKIKVTRGAYVKRFGTVTRPSQLIDTSIKFQNKPLRNINEVTWKGKMTVLSASPYLETRALAHGVKEKEEKSLERASDILAALVRRIPNHQESVLVPIPNRSGKAEYTLTMAENIGKQLGIPVADILTGDEQESMYERKKETGYDNIHLKDFKSLPTDVGNRNYILIDNVLDTGSTAMSALRALGTDVKMVVLGNTAKYKTYNYPISVHTTPVKTDYLPESSRHFLKNHIAEYCAAKYPSVQNAEEIKSHIREENYDSWKELRPLVAHLIEDIQSRTADASEVKEDKTIDINREVSELIAEARKAESLLSMGKEIPSSSELLAVTATDFNESIVLPYVVDRNIEALKAQLENTPHGQDEIHKLSAPTVIKDESGREYREAYYKYTKGEGIQLSEKYHQLLTGKNATALNAISPKCANKVTAAIYASLGTPQAEYVENYTVRDREPEVKQTKNVKNMSEDKAEKKEKPTYDYSNWDYTRDKMPAGVTVESAKVERFIANESGRSVPRYRVQAYINGAKRSAVLYPNDVSAFFEKDKDGKMTHRVTSEMLIAKYFAREYRERQAQTQAASSDTPNRADTGNERAKNAPTEQHLVSLGLFDIPVYAIPYLISHEERADNIFDAEEEKQIKHFEDSLPEKHIIKWPEDINASKEFSATPAFGIPTDTVRVEVYEVVSGAQKQSTPKTLLSSNRQAEILLDAFAVSGKSSSPAIYLNKDGKRLPETLGSQSRMSPLNALLVAMSSDAKGYATNVVTTYSGIKNHEDNITKGEKSIPLSYHTVSRYANTDDITDTLDPADYQELSDNDKKRYSAEKNMEYQPYFNIDQTTMKSAHSEEYKDIVSSNGASSLSESEIQERYDTYLNSISSNLVRVIKNADYLLDNKYNAPSDEIFMPSPSESDYKTTAENIQDFNRNLAKAVMSPRRLDIDRGETYNALVAELVSAYKQLEMGLPASISKASRLEELSNLIRYNPSIMQTLDRDVNAVVTTIRKAENAEKVEKHADRSCPSYSDWCATLPQETKELPDCFTEIRMLQDDNKQWNVYLQVAGASEGFSVLTSREDAKLYFDVQNALGRAYGADPERAKTYIETQFDPAEFRLEFAQKYYDLAMRDASKVNRLFDSLATSEELLRVSDVKTEREGDKVYLSASIDGQEQPKKVITSEQWSRILLSSNRPASEKNLAGTLYLDELTGKKELAMSYQEKSEDKTNVHAELLASALSSASSQKGIWLNKDGKTPPMLHGISIPVSPFNAMELGLNSDKNGYKSNVYTRYSIARQEHINVRGGQNGIPFNWYDWSKYVNRYDPKDIIEKKTYDTLPQEEKELYRPMRTKEVQTMFNIDQTIMKQSKPALYKEYMSVPENKKEKDSYKADLALKEKYPNILILYHVGDFYEAYKEDAVKASEVLGITLTQRKDDEGKPLKMAGFPCHALDTYLPKLIRAGNRVAITNPEETKKISTESEKIYAESSKVLRSLKSAGVEETKIAPTSIVDGKLQVNTSMSEKDTLGLNKDIAMAHLNELYHAAMTFVSMQDKLDIAGRTKQLPEDAAKYQKLVEEVGAGVLMQSHGYTATLKKENLSLTDYWSRELREDPSLISRLEYDVNNSVKAVRDIIKGESVDYAAVRGEKPSFQYGNNYTISEALNGETNLQNKLMILVQDKSSKSVDVILPEGASLTLGEEIQGMNKNRILIALRKEGYDGDKVTWYNAGGAMAIKQPNNYYAGKNIEIARLKQYELVRVTSLDVTKELKSNSEVKIEKIQMAVDDNNRRVLYIAPSKEYGKPFVVVPDRKDIDKFYTTIRTTNASEVAQELGNKYYELAQKHPELVVTDSLMPKECDEEMRKHITSVSISKSRDNDKSIVMWVSIDGKKLPPVPITNNEYQRLFLVQDSDTYKTSLAAKYCEEKLKQASGEAIEEQEKDGQERTLKEVAQAANGNKEDREEKTQRSIHI